MREPEGREEHAASMNSLEDDGVVVAGGPLTGGPNHRSLLVVRGSGERPVLVRLAEDPWRRAGVLRLVSLEPWELLLGKERLGTAT